MSFRVFGEYSTFIGNRSLRPLILALGPGHERDLDKLKEMRTRLSNEVVDVINEFGPKLYDDFDQVSPLHIAIVLSSDIIEVPYLSPSKCPTIDRPRSLASEEQCWTSRCPG